MRLSPHFEVLHKQCRADDDLIATLHSCQQFKLTYHVADLSELKGPNGKLQIDLIAEAVAAPLTVQICKAPDGSDWLLGVGGYAKVQP